MEKIIEKDIAVIGAGPTGLFTVFEAGMMGYSCAVIDSLEEVGGQLSALYPEKPIYDIPGHPHILAIDLVKNLEAQAAPFKPEYILGEPVSTLEGQAGHFTLKAGEVTIKSKAVCIASGGGMFVPRKPPLENIADFENSSIHYSVRGKDRFKGQTLVVAGGGDSAADWAVELAENIAAHVHVIHRRAQFRAADVTVERMKALVEAGKITLHTPYQLSQVSGENGQLQKVTIADLDGAEKDIEADHLLCFFGISPTLGPMEKWGLQVENKKIVINPETMSTNVKGIVAIGDAVDYPAKLSLILTGFAESALAMKTVQGVIDPDKKFKVVYSTSKGVPSAS